VNSFGVKHGFFRGRIKKRSLIQDPNFPGDAHAATEFSRTTTIGNQAVFLHQQGVFIFKRFCRQVGRIGDVDMGTIRTVHIAHCAGAAADGFDIDIGAGTSPGFAGHYQGGHGIVTRCHLPLAG